MKWQFRFLTSIGLAFLLSGCLTTHVGERVKLNSESEARLEGQCREISAIGDVQSLIHKVNLNTDEILNLSSLPNPSSQLARITILSDEIESLVDRIKFLITKEWTDSSVDFKAQWKLGLKDFGLKEGPWPVEVSFNRIKIRSVIVNGKEQDWMKEQVAVKVNGNSLDVELLRKSSVLEACILSKAVAVIIEVRYFAYGNVQSGEFGPGSEFGNRTFKLVLTK